MFFIVYTDARKNADQKFETFEKYYQKRKAATSKKRRSDDRRTRLARILSFRDDRICNSSSHSCDTKSSVRFKYDRTDSFVVGKSLEIFASGGDAPRGRFVLSLFLPRDEAFSLIGATFTLYPKNNLKKNTHAFHHLPTKFHISNRAVPSSDNGLFPALKASSVSINSSEIPTNGRLSWDVYRTGK